MSFNFEKFDGVGNSYFPKISIRANGTLGISQGALNRFDLAQGDWWVQLLFDRKNRVIGLEPSDEEGSGRIKLNKKHMVGNDGKESINAWISAKAFLDYYGIPYSKTQSYVAKRNDSEKIIYIELDQPRNATVAPKTGGATES
jgi:hypothetical protein